MIVRIERNAGEIFPFLRVAAWRDFLDAHPSARLYCFGYGGARSVRHSMRIIVAEAMSNIRAEELTSDRDTRLIVQRIYSVNEMFRRIRAKLYPGDSGGPRSMRTELWSGLFAAKKLSAMWNRGLPLRWPSPRSPVRSTGPR